MPPREVFNYPGARHFVTFSTYQRRRFLEPDAAKEIVVQTLQGFLVLKKVKCSAFVIMPNHVHAIVFRDEDFNVSQFVQVWKKSSSYQIKRLYREFLSHYVDLCPENCPIWQAGFYDFNVDSDAKLDQKIDYIHHNPIEEGLCDYAHEWRWSSARFYHMNESVGVTVTP